MANRKVNEMFLNKLKPKPLNTWEQELQQEKKEQEKTFYKAGILHRKLREKFKKNKMERNDKAPIYNLSAEQQAELEALAGHFFVGDSRRFDIVADDILCVAGHDRG